MTVSTQVSRNEYTGNGATTQYDFTFRILDKSHLLVQTLDTSENIVTLTLGTDYTVTGVNRYNGGKVVLTSALPAGYKISIERRTPLTQETSIRNQGGFFPEIHEDAFDKLTMLIQQVYGWWSGLALKKPSWLANYYDALGNRIRNLRDPSQAQDAATKNYVDQADADLQQQITGNLSRTLRVPEPSISPLPTVTGRRKKILAFDDNGSPIAVLPESGSAADVLIDLASGDGFKLIGQVTSWSALRQTKITHAGDVILLKAYNEVSTLFMLPSGGGRFIAVAGSATDDGGSICVPDGQSDFYWMRLRDRDEIHMSEYGLLPGDEIAVKLQAAVDFSRSVGITKIVLSPSYGEVYYTWSAQVNVDNTKYPIHILGGSGNNMNEVMVKLYPSADNELAIHFYTTTDGSSPTEAAEFGGFYLYNQKTDINTSPIQFSDSWTHKLHDVYITHYTKSAGVRIVNSRSWTENFIGNNINIRHCKRGFWLYTTGSWQSFYGFTLRNYYFNHGSDVGDVSDALLLGDGTSTGYAFIYAADMEIGGWLGALYETGSHSAIRVTKYSLCIGKCRMNYDGTKQGNFGKYFQSVITEDTQCIVNLDLTNNSDQFSYVSVQAPDAGDIVSYAMWDNLAYPMLSGSKTYGRSNWMNVAMARAPIILRGGNQKWKTTVTSTSVTKTSSGIIRVTGLPILSNFKVEIKTSGSNQVCNRTFIVNTHNQDLVASVTEQQQLKAETSTTSSLISTTTLSQYSSFTTQRVYCRTYNGVQPGYYSAGNGQSFDIVIPPATYNGTSSNSDSVTTSGLTTAIEIIITQI